MEDYKVKFEKLIQRIYDLTIKGEIDEKAGKSILKDFTVESEDESEDERIRKALIESFKINDLKSLIIPGFSAKDVIDWLERVGKQNEQNFWEKCKHCECFDGYDLCLHKKNFGSVTNESKENCKNNNFFIEKQVEQNPEINDNILLRFSFYQYDDDTLYLSSVFVEECNRKRGYGAKILKAAEEVAKTFGISKIRLKVETNSWMEEWYKRNGYEYLTSEGKYDWLEKQCEQKPNFCHHEVDFSDCSEEYIKAYYDGWNNCNQQHAQLEAEQKPVIEGTFVNVDKVREGFMKEVYRVLDADSTNDRANQIIDAFDQLPTTIIQKPTDKVEPKFKVGDWIINSKGMLRHIVDVDKTGYQTDNGWLTHEDYEKSFHLWSIKDAKDGDALYHKSPLTGIEYIVMSRGVNDNECTIDSYFRYSTKYGFDINIPSVLNTISNDITPATKEQRALLFSKMKEAGYEWDAEKKELKKIEKQSTEAQNEEELSDFEYALLSAFSDGWQQYLLGEGVDAAQWAKEHSAELLEAAKQKPAEWNEKDERMLDRLRKHFDWGSGYYFNRNDCDEADDWLISLKERIKGE